MRADADRARIERLLTELARHGSSGDRIYLSGGTSAVEYGWREFTQDVDIRIESENEEPLLRAIAELKERLDVNVELASPLDFLPAPPGWRDRSPFLGRYGAVDVFHTDFALQALAKLERGLERDLGDVQAMLARGLTTAALVRETFDAIEPELYRFPAVDAVELRSVVAAFVAANRD
ncbi:MAG: hypothetical protein KGL15_08460 [Acidobacteriota bacterium]|nr:hypothetical protein [Acidobacteriota bacterium]